MVKTAIFNTEMLQRCIFQRNAILPEIIESKQKPSTIKFLLPPYL